MRTSLRRAVIEVAKRRKRPRVGDIGAAGAPEILEVGVAQQVAELDGGHANRHAIVERGVGAGGHLCIQGLGLLRIGECPGLVAGNGQHVAALPVGQGQRAQRLDVAGVAGPHRAGQGNRALVAANRAGRIADVGAGRIALGVAGPDEGAGQLALQAGIVRGLARQALERLKGALHDQLPRRGRARHVVDGVVDVEDERGSQGAHVVEAALGAEARVGGNRRLPQHGHDAGDDEHRHRRRHGDRRAMPPHEQPRRVAGGASHGPAPDGGCSAGRRPRPVARRSNSAKDGVRPSARSTMASRSPCRRLASLSAVVPRRAARVLDSGLLMARSLGGNQA